jgi:uncharacterized protein YegP (UPF0339 family)
MAVRQTCPLSTFIPSVMAYKFQVFQDKQGKVRFNFVAPNGEVMLASQAYAQKSSAMKAIESLKKNVGGAEVVEEESAE